MGLAMTFRFRKLYADVVAADGTVAVVYLTWLEAWGVRLASAGVEQYGPDGRREVSHARPAGWTFDPDCVGNGWSVRLELPDGGLELHYRDALPAWYPPEPAPHQAMAWHVLIPRAAVEGFWSRGTVHRRLEGEGYSDWVELRRAPRSLGMRELNWGRVHLPTETLVFTALTFRSGRTWNRAVGWGEDGARRELDLEVSSDPAGTVGLQGVAGPRLTLSPARLLHDGSGLDVARFPATPARLVAHAVTGSLHERRWLARATTSQCVDTGWALHEVVHFGAGVAAHPRRT
jgi:hypothetical protein